MLKFITALDGCLSWQGNSWLSHSVRLNHSTTNMGRWFSSQNGRRRSAWISNAFTVIITRNDDVLVDNHEIQLLH